MASRSLGASANDPTSRGTWIYLPPPPLPPPEYNEQSSMMTSSGGSASVGDSANDPTLEDYPHLHLPLPPPLPPGYYGYGDIQRSSESNVGASDLTLEDNT